MLEQDGPCAVKLIDFGLARLITPSVSSVGGTREWSPPEQIANPRLQPTHQLDIFAFGSIAYFMEHGISPMQGISSDSEVLLDSGAVLAWPRSRRAFLTDQALDVVHSCLTVSPGMRPESIDGVRNSLQETVERLGADAQPLASAASELPPTDWSERSFSPEAAVSHI